MSGRFITLEGGEGVGKTTNIAYIQSLLEENNIPFLLTREPGAQLWLRAFDRYCWIKSKRLLLNKQNY